ncbi:MULTISPECIES: hypothetical protein [Nocardia]|uniref:hypothetical protein n=1 Tax=Nocardia TaxID=1817 RepID=UPI0007A4B8C1|nr:MULTISPECIES: hypothetical protein [Nocardia]
MKFRRLIENNDHEGETWNWWLQVDGSEEELARLEELMAKFDSEFFTLTDDIENREVVDLLVRYSALAYYADHNLVLGVLTLPDLSRYERADDVTDLLYKGRIADYYKEAE